MQLPKVATREELEEFDVVAVKEKGWWVYWSMCRVKRLRELGNDGILVIEDEDGVWLDEQIEKIVLLERSEDDDVV
ncbi:MAG TPA: hypothetical protein VLL52_17345 [Anaerolineae bacterium]|nr:hypothetical protein [Anaerolineae bacterium]